MPEHVTFHSLVPTTVLKERAQLKKFIPKIFKAEGKQFKTLSVIFCSDHYLLRLNRQYLKHNFYTDVIAFDLSDDQAVRAEIYISVDRVRENAKLNNCSTREELHRVIFHGVLHLCGYRDKSAGEKAIIRERESFYLTKYFVTVPRGTLPRR